MQLFFLILTTLSLFFSQSTPGIKGAWELRGVGDPGEVATMIATDNYLTVAVYNENTNAFIRTYGGKYEATPGKCLLTIEFNSTDTAEVGKQISYNTTLGETSLTLEHLVKTTWTKIDDAPATAPLSGCWRITARIGNDGNLSPMHQGSRKTLKINSSTRFQWVAINPASKQFFGTGGGKYTLMDGIYTEQLAFFSRDPTRVGSQLVFNAEVQGPKWIHKGKSSTGNDVHEVWEKQ
ncbi:MAG: hypothetical protein SH818_05015 [Saprospiraceae bacterium]|nr:hypothetical protein [Saprospiraceae bacterium]